MTRPFAPQRRRIRTARRARYDALDMPKREHITIQSSPDQPLRVTIVRPDGPSIGRMTAAVINRGVAASEPEIDFIEALADGLAEAGVMAMHFEPRTARLILDDLHAFTLEDEVNDLARVIEHALATPGVEASQSSVVGCWLGALATLSVVSRVPALRQVVLICPAFPSASSSGPADPLPRAYVEAVSNIDRQELVARSVQPVSIIAAAADRPASDDSLSLLTACLSANRSAERWLVARADRLFSGEQARSACIERVIAALTSPARAAAARPKAGAAT
jgi:hypothetical protein